MKVRGSRSRTCFASPDSSSASLQVLADAFARLHDLSRFPGTSFQSKPLPSLFQRGMTWM